MDGNHIHLYGSCVLLDIICNKRLLERMDTAGHGEEIHHLPLKSRSAGKQTHADVDCWSTKTDSAKGKTLPRVAAGFSRHKCGDDVFANQFFFTAS